MVFKAGFVNIIGKPNVGKSTLMNALTGEKLSIITSKAQTTRHRIIGIVNGKDFQIVLSDTPGIIKPVYKLQRSMLRVVKTALTDADILLYVTDMLLKKQPEQKFMEKLAKGSIPVIALINKVDLADQEDVVKKMDQLKVDLPNADVIPVSALHGFNIEKLFGNILDLLPEGDAYYPPDILTDRPERFFVSEIIREKIFMIYKQEVPYCCNVEIEDFKEQDNLIKIRTVIFVAKESQKGIVIGKAGSKLKRLGSDSRKEIETFLGKKVFLELFVKVSKDWRNKDHLLKKYGYTN